jgi:hypothetical protein
MAPIKLTIAYGSAFAGDLIDRVSAEHGRVRVEAGCRSARPTAIGETWLLSIQAASLLERFGARSLP